MVEITMGMEKIEKETMAEFPGPMLLKSKTLASSAPIRVNTQESPASVPARKLETVEKICSRVTSTRARTSPPNRRRCFHAGESKVGLAGDDGLVFSDGFLFSAAGLGSGLEETEGGGLWWLGGRADFVLNSGKDILHPIRRKIHCLGQLSQQRTTLIHCLALLMCQ
jgi:hypothetical protein